MTGDEPSGQRLASEPVVGAGEDDADTTRQAVDAFAVLSDPARVDIVRALGGADPPGGPGYLSFSELRDHVAIEDSGRFNYHLDQLRDGYVRREEAGYRLTHDGLLVYQAIVRGTFAERESVGPVAVEEPCPDCGGDLTMRHDGGGFIALECPGCGRRLFYDQFPWRGLVGRTVREALRAADAWLRRQVALMSRGTCSACGGLVSPSIVADGDDLPEFVDGREPAYALYVCEHCGIGLYVSLLEVALDHPALVSFLHEGGIDVRETPIWELEELAEVRVEGDPELVVGLGEGELRLTFDESAAVVAHERG